MTSAAAQGQLLVPMEPGELSTANADYCVRITEAAHINEGGYFAMEMYEQDQYPGDAVQALSAGDIIVVNGDLVQVDSLIEYEEGMLEIRPSGEFDGYIALIPSGENYCALVNDWISCTYVETVKVWLPLPDAFAYLSVEADDQLQYSADEFIRMLAADGGGTDESIQHHRFVPRRPACADHACLLSVWAGGVNRPRRIHHSCFGMKTPPCA